MKKEYIGKKRAEHLAWFCDHWLEEGPPVSFLQGFSGVGKTDLARDVRDLAEKRGWNPAVINEIADRGTPNVLESLMELSCMLSQQGLPDMEQVLFEQTNPNAGLALEKALQQPVLIILDEAQRFFKPNTGSPLREMNAVLSHLRNRRNLKGRLLLLSDRIVEEARWSEWIPIRTLDKLDPDEAVLALETKLKEAEVDADIPAGRKKEVVRDLDFNPRAIEALVSALRHDSLDEIIEGNPGLWAVRDRDISREFLRKLERDLLERTMRHLEEVELRRLWRLAVHRRSFKREALEKICGSKDEAAKLRGILVTRYLVNYYRGDLTLNPIVREISLSHLREESAEFRQAHSAAAEYHMRHFKAKQIVGKQSKLGDSFAELRYHLVQAGRGSELRDVGQRFTDHLKKQIKSVSPVPTDREELDERIAVLTILLGDGGAKGLEYHIARCLQKRGAPGDIDKAITHARRALNKSDPTSWRLAAELLSRDGTTVEAVKLLREGIEVIPADKNLFSLYQNCAELLSQSGKLDDAIKLLREGILVIPPDKGLPSLYQTCADLLARADKPEEAISLLREGIGVIPPDKNVFSLYQVCGDLLFRNGSPDEAISLLREGIEAIPADKNAFSLYKVCAELMSQDGKTDEAVNLLKDGIKVVPADKNAFSLYQVCGELLSRDGKPDEAVSLLKEGIKVIRPDKGLPSLYQVCAEVLARDNKTEEAISLLKEGIVVIPADKNVFSLYQYCAELLSRDGKTKEAVALLREGIKAIPADKGLFSLYQICAELLFQDRKTDEAVMLLKQGIRVIPVDKNVAALYQFLSEIYRRGGQLQKSQATLRDGALNVPDRFGGSGLVEHELLLLAATGNAQGLADLIASGRSIFEPQLYLGKTLQLQMAGDWAGAVALCENKFPTYPVLSRMAWLGRLCTGDVESAWKALSSCPNPRLESGSPNTWMAVFVHLRRGATSEARKLLATYLNRPIDEARELTESFLLRLWDQQELAYQSRWLCFYFPILPPVITGLEQTVSRVQFGPPVLPLRADTETSATEGAPQNGDEKLPKVYVSYAWGEDSTDAGRKREEIVDRLCAAVRHSGRAIGRDKERMQSGDSIERFAREISMANRIVAVISQKSLHSDFCMVQELFRAYRRCDFQKDEFQEKVIAVVMDDARPLLKDNYAIVTLAAKWQKRLEQLRTELLSVDPHRKSKDTWNLVEMMESMCPRLPDMLGALKDTVMKRGFEEVTRDGFQEIIRRLPPVSDS